MPEKNLLEKILSDFLASRPSLDGSSLGTLQEFCQYATTWLAEKGLLGVGHAVDGISLRFADGQEYLLTAARQGDDIANMPAMSITGNNGGSVRGAGAMQDAAVRITG